MEHIGIDPADCKPLVIDPAPAGFEKPAGSIRIVFYPEGIAGYVKGTVLVAEFRAWRRFEGRQIYFSCLFNLPVKKEHVTVKSAGAAFCTAGAVKTDILQDTGEAVLGISTKGILLFVQCCNAGGDRD
jgi:hypothetical protein